MLPKVTFAKLNQLQLHVHMQISMNVLLTLTTVASMQCVAILWDRTPAHVKQDTQAMEGNALVS